MDPINEDEKFKATSKKQRAIVSVMRTPEGCEVTVVVVVVVVV